MPYVGNSVCCSKCSNYGPSSTTGFNECFDCKRCETCCEKDDECPKADAGNRALGVRLADEEGYGGFPARGGVVSDDGVKRKKKKAKGKKKKKKGKKEASAAAEEVDEVDEEDEVPSNVIAYTQALTSARNGLPLCILPTQCLGDDEGTSPRGFTVPRASGGLRAVLQKGVKRKVPGIVTGQGWPKVVDRHLHSHRDPRAKPRSCSNQSNQHHVQSTCSRTSPMPGPGGAVHSRTRREVGSLRTTPVQGTSPMLTEVRPG